jgi:glucosamine--fructose-6-phosphate aminotransferase (isomerizing)
LTLLAYALAGRGEEGQQVVAKAVAASKLILADTSVSNIQKLADLIKDKKNIFVVGRGLSYPAALETALKIKEISYIHAEGFAAGELKHGVIALIEKGTPCIVFAPNDEAYGANLAGAMELKARGGYIIGVSHKRAEVFDYFLPVADAREATLIPNFIVAQLLAYYLSVKKGLDPDMPRNLAKSVTVK